MGFRSALTVFALVLLVVLAGVSASSPGVQADPDEKAINYSDYCPGLGSKDQCGSYCYYANCEACSTCEREECSTCEREECIGDPEVCHTVSFECACHTIYFECFPCTQWVHYIRGDPEPYSDERDLTALPNTGAILPLGEPLPDFICTDEEGAEVVQPVVDSGLEDGLLLAQVFTTGSNGAGYDLERIALPLTGVDRESVGGLAVEIREYNRGEFDSSDLLVGTLTPPAQFEHGFNLFNAHGVHLKPLTEYYLRIGQGDDPSPDVERAISPLVDQGPQAFGWSIDETAYVFERGDWHRYVGPVRMEVWGEATGLSHADLEAGTPHEGRFRWDNTLLIYVRDSVENPVWWDDTKNSVWYGDVQGQYDWDDNSPTTDNLTVPNPARCDQLLRDQIDLGGVISIDGIKTMVKEVQAAEPFNCGWDVWDPRAGTANTSNIGCYEAEVVGGQTVPLPMQKSYENALGETIYYGVKDPTLQYPEGIIIHWLHEDKYAPAAGVGCWLRVGSSWSVFQGRYEVSGHIPVGIGGEEVTQLLPGSTDPFERVFYQGEDPVEGDPGGPRLVPIEGDPEGPRLIRVMKIDDERFELKFETVPVDKRPILYRVWGYDGGVPHLGVLQYPVRQLVLNPYDDDVGLVSVRLEDWQEKNGGPGPASGLYAFQVAYLDVVTGGAVNWSNVGFQIVGYEQAPVVSPINWTADYQNEVYHNSATPMPTPEFSMTRPSAPVILRLEQYGVEGWVGVFVGSPAVGRFEYRMWTYHGGRHLDGNVPWVEMNLGSGDNGTFQVRVPLVEDEHGVEVPMTGLVWAFEVRQIALRAAHDEHGVFLGWEDVVSEGSNVETILVWGDSPGFVPTPWPVP